jgi:hypothetical protein
MTVVRRLAFLLILLIAAAGIVAAQSTPKKGVAEQKRSLDAQEAKQANQYHEAADKVTATAGDQPSAKALDTQAPYTSEDIEMQRKLVAFTKWLVIVGFIQAIILGCTIWAIAHQAATAKNSERAWITVRPAIWSPELHARWEQSDQVPKDGKLEPFVHMFPAIIRNVGKTPAKIDEIAMQYELLDSLSELSAVPNYKNRIPQDGYLLVPDEENGVQTILTDRTGGAGMLTKEQVAAINAQKSFLYAFGSVVYRDVYERRWETQVGYVYNFPQGGWINFEKASFKKAGPSSYNKAT